MTWETPVDDIHLHQHTIDSIDLSQNWHLNECKFPYVSRITYIRTHTHRHTHQRGLRICTTPTYVCHTQMEGYIR